MEKKCSICGRALAKLSPCQFCLASSIGQLPTPVADLAIQESYVHPQNQTHDHQKSTLSSQVTNVVYENDLVTIEDDSNRLSTEIQQDSPFFTTPSFDEDSVTHSMPFKRMSDKGSEIASVSQTERFSSRLGKTEAPFARTEKREPNKRLVPEGIFTKTVAHEVHGSTSPGEKTQWTATKERPLVDPKFMEEEEMVEDSESQYSENDRTETNSENTLSEESLDNTYGEFINDMASDKPKSKGRQSGGRWAVYVVLGLILCVSLVWLFMQFA